MFGSYRSDKPTHIHTHRGSKMANTCSKLSASMVTRVLEAVSSPPSSSGGWLKVHRREKLLCNKVLTICRLKCNVFFPSFSFFFFCIICGFLESMSDFCFVLCNLLWRKFCV